MTKFPVAVRLVCSHVIKTRLPPFPAQKLACPHGCGYQMEWESCASDRSTSVNPKVKKWKED